ncbi:MAG TPA: hypothetical protein VJZ27_03790 [Aggregatilineales bacterium]|nr:hypothetical protein [Aggregatilineales bacterium]
MIYKVQAQFTENKISEFYEMLKNGTIRNQRPDGMEIVASMKRAKIIAPGQLQWSEQCFCSPPLKHERSTVYDHYLSNIRAEAIKEYEDYEGESFWDYMAAASQDFAATM